jgi:hypothetical protein
MERLVERARMIDLGELSLSLGITAAACSCYLSTKERYRGVRVPLDFVDEVIRRSRDVMDRREGRIRELNEKLKN